jgi:putative membrane protein
VRTSHGLLIFAAASSLSACGSQVTAPSLLPRAVEKQPIDMPVSEPTERETPADPALQAQIAKYVADAEAGDKAFAEQRAAADAAVARAAGTAPGDELWVQAQEKVTALETARVAVRDAAAAIDALRLDPANAGTGSRAAIDAATARIEAIERAEAQAVAALNAKLG